MAIEIVGGIAYEVSLDTRKMLSEQREVDRQLRKTTSSLDTFDARLTQVTRAIGAYSAALYVVRQSDAFTKLNAQLKLATDSSVEFANAQAKVRQIAQEAQTDISGVGTLFARVSTATKELGVSQQQVADITRTVALALKVSGAGAQESASATLQLSQAFASGVLRGEEFNAVSEAAPRLMKALADGIGRPVGELREMAAAGLLTSSVLADALPKALKDLEREAQQVQTISGAFQQLRNEVLLFIGEQTTASGAAKITAEAISTLAANIDTLAAAALGYAATKLARVLLDVGVASGQSAKAAIESVAAHHAARTAAIAETAARIENIAATQAGIVVARQEMSAKLASANVALQAANAQAAAARAAGAQSFALAMVRDAELAATAATRARSAAIAELAILGQQQARVTAAMTAAQAAHTAAITATGTAATIASRALGLLGGPIGAITTLLGLGATAWMIWGDAAEKSENKAADSMARSTEEIVASLDKQIAKLKERNRLAGAGLAGIAKQESEAAARLATLQRQIDNLMAGKGPEGGAPLPEAARVDLLQKLLTQYGQLAGKVTEVTSLQKELDAAGQEGKLGEWMAKYATDAERMAAEIKKAKAELGSAFTPELEQRIRQKYTKKDVPKKDEPKDFFNDAQDELEERLRRGYDRIADSEIEAAERARRKVEEAAERDRQKIADQQRAAQDILVGGDPVAQAQLELERKSALLAEYAAKDQENAQLYAEARVALEKQTAERIREVIEQQEAKKQAAFSAALQNYASLFGNMADLAKTFAGKQSGIYKAMFAVSKAFAIADSIVKIQAGIANAAALPFPANLGAMATVAAATANIISTIQSTKMAEGRQYGGPVSAGSLYRVNETGRPEMFVGSGGRQYMMPTSGGSVVPADQVGGGVAWTINVHNAPAGTTATVDQSARVIDIAVGRAKAEIAEEFAQNSGSVYAALRGATNVQGRF